MPSSAPNTRQRRSPIRRIASAPIMNTTILLHGPPSRRNMLKSARRNARASAVRKSPGSKLPKTRSARRNLIKKFPAAYAARQARAENAYEKMRQMYPSAGLRPRGLAGVQGPRPPRAPAMSMMTLIAMRRPKMK